MRRDKKAAQKKKEREVARRDAHKSSAASSYATSLRLAHASTEAGPAFMTREWMSEEPRLVNVIVTRVLPNGSFFAHCILVDRTSLGVKNAFSTGPLTKDELDDIVEEVGAVHHEAGIEPVQQIVAQSVVFHALDYAKSLGLEPHPDFDPQLLGPRPDTLADTPLAKPARPVFIPGQEDDVDAIVDKLEKAVGPDGFDFGTTTKKYPGETAIQRAVKRWGDVYGGKIDHGANIAAYAKALGSRDERALGSSLAFYWGMFFRPLVGGKTGVELALESPAMAKEREALELLAKTQAVLFDVDEIREGSAVCRDVFDDTKLEVRFSEEELVRMKGARGFAYLTPLGDGTWFSPTAMISHPNGRKVEPQQLLERTNALMRELGIEERIDPAVPASGLRRYGPLFQGLLHRALTSA